MNVLVGGDDPIAMRRLQVLAEGQCEQQRHADGLGARVASDPLGESLAPDFGDPVRRSLPGAAFALGPQAGRVHRGQYLGSASGRARVWPYVVISVGADS